MKANLASEHFYLKAVKEGRLRVTKSGRVFNTASGKEVAANRSENKYLRIGLTDLTTHKQVFILLHRLVWACFKGIPEDPHLEINHKDGNKGNCRLSNLELVTSSDNIRHAFAHSLQPVVFTYDEVISIRKEFAKGKTSVKALAKYYGVGKQPIYHALKSETYVTRYDKKCLNLLAKNQSRGHVTFEDREVRKFRRLFGTGKMSCKELANVGAVGYNSMHQLLKCQHYKHVKTPYDELCKSRGRSRR